MSGTRIVVLQSRKIIYSLIFLGIGILLLIFLIMLFAPEGKNGGESASLANAVEQKYDAGVYTKELKLGDATVNLQLSLDEDYVKSLELVNLDESVETMYPLMQPTVEKIAEQLVQGKSMDEIVISEEAQYTEKMIVESVSEMLREHEK